MVRADEEARIALWLSQRQARIVKRAELDASLAGDPVAAAVVLEGFMRLVRASQESRLPPPPTRSAPPSTRSRRSSAFGSPAAAAATRARSPRTRARPTPRPTR